MISRPYHALPLLRARRLDVGGVSGRAAGKGTNGCNKPAVAFLQAACERGTGTCSLYQEEVREQRMTAMSSWEYPVLRPSSKVR